jgi:hypothetical protein
LAIQRRRASCFHQIDLNFSFITALKVQWWLLLYYYLRSQSYKQFFRLKNISLYFRLSKRLFDSTIFYNSKSREEFKIYFVSIVVSVYYILKMIVWKSNIITLSLKTHQYQTFKSSTKIRVLPSGILISIIYLWAFLLWYKSYHNQSIHKIKA